MKKTYQIKRLIKIICVTLVSIILLLIIDSRFKNDFENPIKVSRAFALSLMCKDREHMKSWSCKELHDKIDEVKPSRLLSCVSEQGWPLNSKFNLVCFRRLDDTIVCTYALDNFTFHSVNEPLFYTVLLEPCGPTTLWERVKEFVSMKFPYGENIFRYPYIKQRWLVIDFYSIDNLEKIYTQEIQWFEGLPAAMREKTNIDINEFGGKIEERMRTRFLRLNHWREQEKIEQNLQMRELYHDYDAVE